MKRLSSRWLSLLLVLSLVFSLLTPALAADDAETVSDLPDEAVVLVEEEASEAAAEAPALRPLLWAPRAPSPEL